MSWYFRKPINGQWLPLECRTKGSWQWLHTATNTGECNCQQSMVKLHSSKMKLKEALREFVKKYDYYRLGPYRESWNKDQDQEDLVVQDNQGVKVFHHTKYLEIDGVDEGFFIEKQDHSFLHWRLRVEGQCKIPIPDLAVISTRARYRRLSGKPCAIIKPVFPSVYLEYLAWQYWKEFERSLKWENFEIG